MTENIVRIQDLPTANEINDNDRLPIGQRAGEMSGVSIGALREALAPTAEQVAALAAELPLIRQVAIDLAQGGDSDIRGASIASGQVTDAAAVAVAARDAAIDAIEGGAAAREAAIAARDVAAAARSTALAARDDAMAARDDAVAAREGAEAEAATIAAATATIAGAVQSDDLAGPDGAAGIGMRAPGAGTVNRPISQRLLDLGSAPGDFGSLADGVASDRLPLLQAVIAAQTGDADGSGRLRAGLVFLKPGNYVIDDELDLAGPTGVVGLKFVTAGRGSVRIFFHGTDATIRCTSSRAIVFEDITFVGAGVDVDQTSFTIQDGGPALRSWDWHRCDWEAFYKVWDVKGASMCSEMNAVNCGILQCYWGLYNQNDQCVNFNMVNVNFENNEIDTSKDKSKSAPICCRKGTGVKWTGGSIINFGPWVLLDLREAFAFNSAAHKITFDGCRGERVDDGGTCAPLVDRFENGTYVTEGNGPSITFQNCPIICRGDIPPTVAHIKLWNGLLVNIVDCEIEAGRIVEIYDGLTTGNVGQCNVVRSSRLTIGPTLTSKTSSHDFHCVTIQPQARGSEFAMLQDRRQGSNSIPATVYAKRLIVRGPTGNLPIAGDKFTLPIFDAGTVFSRLKMIFYSLPGVPLTLQLVDDAETSVFCEVVTDGNQRGGEALFAFEVGAQIPVSTRLAVRMLGTPTIVKGMIIMEYEM